MSCFFVTQLRLSSSSSSSSSTSSTPLTSSPRPSFLSLPAGMAALPGESLLHYQSVTLMTTRSSASVVRWQFRQSCKQLGQCGAFAIVSVQHEFRGLYSARFEQRRRHRLVAVTRVIGNWFNFVWRVKLFAPRWNIAECKYHMKGQNLGALFRQTACFLLMSRYSHFLVCRPRLVLDYDVGGLSIQYDNTMLSRAETTGVLTVYAVSTTACATCSHHTNLFDVILIFNL